MRRMSTNTDDLVTRLLSTMSAKDLLSLVPLTEAARRRGLSTDTLQREDDRRVARGERAHIVDVSERRKGVRLIDVLCPDAE
jgi:hypothetical protein